MSTNVLSGNRNRMSLRTMVQVAMLSALSAVLMLVEVPLWFAPPFYQIDLSEVPVLVGTFAMGPVAGIAIELVKVLLNLVLNGTQTVGVGEFANFLIGCSLVVPAGIVYRKMKSRKGALIGAVIGISCMALLGGLINAYVLLPTYAKAFGMPMDVLIGMGTAVNSGITGLTSFIMLAVVPFNVLKGAIATLITMLIYKKISPILK